MVDPMIDLDRRYGIWSGRVWGLIVNLMANTLALYGLVGFLRDGTHLVHLIVGTLMTVACILILAMPADDPEE
jgi:heme/copper-type cytochrome/quinol oxidase subunit 3